VFEDLSFFFRSERKESSSVDSSECGSNGHGNTVVNSLTA
jgi:hypothetical protein